MLLYGNVGLKYYCFVRGNIQSFAGVVYSNTTNMATHSCFWSEQLKE